MDGGAWWAAVHGVTKSRTRLSNFTFTFHFHTLEKEMATYSSILAWRILWTEEPSGLLSMGSHRVGHDWSDLACMHSKCYPYSRVTLKEHIRATTLPSFISFSCFTGHTPDCSGSCTIDCLLHSWTFSYNFRHVKLCLAPGTSHLLCLECSSFGFTPVSVFLSPL